METVRAADAVTDGNTGITTGYFSLNRLEGLDTVQLFKRFRSGCLDILSGYTARMPLLMKDLEFQTPAEDCSADNNFSDEDEGLKQYAITVHGIRGASYAITAYRAGQAAKNLEQAAWEGNIVFIRHNTPDFILYMEQFIDSLEQFIRQARGVRPVQT
jgi:hypothetical protein